MININVFRIILLLISLFLSIFIFSCKHFNKNTNQDNVQIIRGEINEDGDFKKVNQDKIKSDHQKAILSSIGDEVEIPINTPFELTIDNLDPNEIDLQFSLEENEKTGYKIGRIKVVDKNENVVILNEKCQIANTGPGPIPKVFVSEKLPKQQVVITPRYNSKCEFLGWEIRNGSIEQGCIKGKDVLNQLKKCFEKKKPPKYDNDYWIRVLFGID